MPLLTKEVLPAIGKVYQERSPERENKIKLAESFLPLGIFLSHIIRQVENQRASKINLPERVLSYSKDKGEIEDYSLFDKKGAENHEHYRN
jgi:hypothetical protein